LSIFCCALLWAFCELLSLLESCSLNFSRTM
jgi:hypothetical protein